NKRAHCDWKVGPVGDRWALGIGPHTTCSFRWRKAKDDKRIRRKAREGKTEKDLVTSVL
ncbi:hypothetical protein Ancab_015644, partial [Ancistrocladus abbreviatus]